MSGGYRCEYKLTNPTRRLNFAMRRIFREKRVKRGRYYHPRLLFFISLLKSWGTPLSSLSFLRAERKGEKDRFILSERRNSVRIRLPFSH